MNYKDFLKLSEKLIRKICAIKLVTPKKLGLMTLENISYAILDQQYGMEPLHWLMMEFT